jgi:2-aminoadipate transaminase
LKDIQHDLARLWQGRDLTSIASGAALELANIRGDWDPPEGVVPKRDPIRLAIGIPDSTTIPIEPILASTRHAIEKSGESAFLYGFGMGYVGLRSQLAARYSRDRNMSVTEDWFQLCNGSSGAIDLICRALINPGDVIIAESPTYMGSLRNFRGMQADVRSVPVDADGMDIEALSELIDRLRRDNKTIKFIYTISTFQNPTGATLSYDRRVALLRLAARHNILILDDDAYGELYFGDQPPATLSALSGGNGVVTVGTFSKTLATGLRIGWIFAEPSILALFGSMRFAMGLNQMMVRVISDYMAGGVLDEHVTSVRSLYRTKMETLADALEHHAGEHMSFVRPSGGFYLWVKLHGINSEDVWRTAMEEGVSLTPGINFYPARVDPDGEHLRLAFPWTPLEQLVEGACRIGDACRRVSSGDGLT